MLLLSFLALAGIIQAQVPGLGFGPTYMMQRTSSYLVEYSTTLRVPVYPASQRGLIVIWPGINTDARPTNLVQTCIGGGSARTFVTYALKREVFSSQIQGLFVQAVEQQASNGVLSPPQILESVSRRAERA